MDLNLKLWNRCDFFEIERLPSSWRLTRFTVSSDAHLLLTDLMMQDRPNVRVGGYAR